MTALDLIDACSREANWQIFVNQFIDDFRRASAAERARAVANGPPRSGRFEGLVAAVASYLCRETGTPAPDWLRTTRSPEPFFALPAQGFELRLRLMIESPAPFLIRNIFVPANYMERA